MSQILLPTERDVGMMITFEPQKKTHKLARIKWDAGFFNGQGLSGTTDFDSHKDFISRLTIKPDKSQKNEISGGLSILRGGWKQGTKYVYTSGVAQTGEQTFVVDSTPSNLGKSSPRHYYGADIQYKWKHPHTETELRAEYWWGTQPGTSNSTTNPGNLPNLNGVPLPTYIRHFDGGFFYFLQHIINMKHQLVIKFDWYDPNIKVTAKDIGKPNSNLNSADIQFSTLGIGYVYYINLQTKVTFYYSIIRNEKCLLAGYTADQRDDVFTWRLQFRF